MNAQTLGFPSSATARWLPRFAALALLFLAILFGSSAWASEGYNFGSDTTYRTLFEPDGRFGILNPRLIIWIFAQLHLLFAAFVLAVPMFAVIIEVIGLIQKDRVKGKQYDELAHEFTRLLGTA